MFVAVLVSFCLTLYAAEPVLSCSGKFIPFDQLLSYCFMFHEDKDVLMIAAELKSLSDWEELSGWLINNKGIIRENCLARTTAVAECCRRELVRTYCDMSSVSPQQVAENMADVLDKKMKNRRIAKALRQLNFTTSKVYSLVCLERFRIANLVNKCVRNINF